MCFFCARCPWFLRSLLMLSLLTLLACQAKTAAPIKVGILHSVTGTMAISEQSVIDATQLAIHELNAEGGLLGRPLEAVLIDGQSDPKVFLKAASRLITKDRVSVIFGCWTSACRKTIRPVIEAHDHLLVYPLQYEGLEASRNILYTGSTPNQQIAPAVLWAVKNLGKRVFLVASDYVFPRAANFQIKHQLSALKAELVGEVYLPLGDNNVQAMMVAIAAARADVILNTINGDSNIAFFQQLQRQNITTPVLSFSVGESELQRMGPGLMRGHYAAWSYFQQLANDENRQFVTAFRRKFGDHRVTDAAMEAAYTGVYLWASAVRSAKTEDSSTVRESLKGQRFNAPSGLVTVSYSNNHLWKPLYIAQVSESGDFKLVWQHSQPIRPLPFPPYLPRKQWQQYLRQLYQGWGENWAAPSIVSATSSDAETGSQVMAPP